MIQAQLRILYPLTPKYYRNRCNPLLLNARIRSALLGQISVTFITNWDKLVAKWTYKLISLVRIRWVCGLRLVTSILCLQTWTQNPLKLINILDKSTKFLENIPANWGLNRYSSITAFLSPTLRSSWNRDSTASNWISLFFKKGIMEWNMLNTSRKVWTVILSSNPSSIPCIKLFNLSSSITLLKGASRLMPSI